MNCDVNCAANKTTWSKLIVMRVGLLLSSCEALSTESSIVIDRIAAGLHCLSYVCFVCSPKMYIQYHDVIYSNLIDHPLVALSFCYSLV